MLILHVIGRPFCRRPLQVCFRTAAEAPSLLLRILWVKWRLIYKLQASLSGMWAGTTCLGNPCMSGLRASDLDCKLSQALCRAKASLLLLCCCNNTHVCFNMHT